jgi:GNAT superfamily N-acetyltransferase
MIGKKCLELTPWPSIFTIERLVVNPVSIIAHRKIFFLAWPCIQMAVLLPKPTNWLDTFFFRVWGKLGWIGTFGVDPDCHGLGIGKKLLTHAIESLENAGCTTIRLETMPDSPNNVGLYARSGFKTDPLIRG